VWMWNLWLSRDFGCRTLPQSSHTTRSSYFWSWSRRGCFL
jgi:hypothetical protein